MALKLKTPLLFVSLILLACSNTNKDTFSRFEGKLVYKISSELDSEQNIDSSHFQIIYAKDSLVRTENFTPIGKQVYIKHIPRNRAYTLLSFYGKDVAIQSIPDSSNIIEGKYKFEYKRKSKNFLGKKAKLVHVTLLENNESFDMYYFPDISHDYTNAIPGLNGLPVQYTLVINGVPLTYTLVEMEEMEVSRDLFGIPGNYEIITADEFSKLISPTEEEDKN